MYICVAMDKPTPNQLKRQSTQLLPVIQEDGVIGLRFEGPIAGEKQTENGIVPVSVVEARDKGISHHGCFHIFTGKYV